MKDTVFLSQIGKDELIEEIAMRTAELLAGTKPSAINDENPNKRFTVEQLINYLPDHPARPTVYGWIWNNKIPYEKHGKRVLFRKSAIDRWNEEGRVMSHVKEIEG